MLTWGVARSAVVNVVAPDRWARNSAVWGIDLHQAEGAGRRGARVELRLGVDHGRDQRRIQVLVGRLLADDVWCTAAAASSSLTAFCSSGIAARPASHRDHPGDHHDQPKAAAPALRRDGGCGAAGRLARGRASAAVGSTGSWPQLLKQR